MVIDLEGQFFVFDHAFEADGLIGGRAAIDQQFYNHQFREGHRARDFLGHDIFSGVMQDIEIAGLQDGVDRIMELTDRNGEFEYTCVAGHRYLPTAQMDIRSTESQSIILLESTPSENPIPQAQRRGKLIVFEGGEGCGKTTQLARIETWLEGSGWWWQLQQAGYRDRTTTREPGGGELCSQIRQLLLTPQDEAMTAKTELLLYAADRAQHVEGCLEPALKAGSLVLCDRYTDSTVAYQGYGRGLDLRLIDQLNTIATGGLRSDLTLWLDLEVEVGLGRALGRGKRDRIEEADLTFHHRVRQGFSALAAREGERVVRIDASLDLDGVTGAIVAVLEARFGEWI